MTDLRESLLVRGREEQVVCLIKCILGTQPMTSVIFLVTATLSLVGYLSSHIKRALVE